MSNPLRKKEPKKKGAPRMAPRYAEQLPDIFRAASEDDVHGIGKALDNGTDVNSEDGEGMTPLHYAAANLAYRAVDRLLEELNSANPIDPAKLDDHNRTASSLALKVHGEAGIEMARKLRPYCYPSVE